jgi:hypothetical protein
MEGRPKMATQRFAFQKCDKDCHTLGRHLQAFGGKKGYDHVTVQLDRIALPQDCSGDSVRAHWSRNE